MVVEVEGADGRPLPLVGPPVKLSATPARARSRPPALGEHTDEILGEIGYTREEIERLRAAGAV
jgi:crotonobetainyl-CoA:carnitine CoA-transferase CaiB-like acyl-CoA transferase